MAPSVVVSTTLDEYTEVRLHFTLLPRTDANKETLDAGCIVADQPPDFRVRTQSGAQLERTCTEINQKQDRRE